MMKFFVKGQRIEITEREVIASGQIAFVTLKFTFDCSWKNLHKVVQFSQCDEVYNRVLGVDGLSCLLPSELHSGMVKMSVFGYDSESDTIIRATTVPVTLYVRESGFDGESCNIPPTPDLYAQLLIEMKKMLSEVQNGSNGTNGKDGENGLSAYELAVQEGFIGSLADWLESLKGNDGKDGANGVNGQDGKDGIDGKDGLSAYEIAVQNGFIGTESEWLESLKGKDGNSSEVSGFATIEYVNEKLSEILAILENLPTTSINYTAIFENGNDTLQKYGESIYTYYNDGYSSLLDFSESYPNFCCADNDYALYFNQNDFSWGGEVFVLCLTPIVLTSSMYLILKYISGETKNAEFYLVRKTDKTGSELAEHIYKEVQSGNAIKQSFKWLYSDTYISVMQSLENVPDGEYYLAFKGMSDNSHPIVQEVKVMN